MQSLIQKLKDCEGNLIKISQKKACQLVEYMKFLAKKFVKLDKSYKQLYFYYIYRYYISQLYKNLKKKFNKII